MTVKILFEGLSSLEQPDSWILWLKNVVIPMKPCPTSTFQAFVLYLDFRNSVNHKQEWHNAIVSDRE